MNKNYIPNFINSSDESLNALFRVARKHPTLTPERERQLAVLMRQGDCEAREELIVSNLLAAVHIANRWTSERTPLRDLIGPAIEGLILGIDSYNPDCDNRLFCYVKWKIEERVQAYCECMRSGMSLPHRQCNLLSTLRDGRRRLEQEMGHTLSDPTLALLLSGELGHDSADLMNIQRAERCTSLDDACSLGADDDDPLTIADRVVAPDDIEDSCLSREMHDILHEELRHLPSRTAQVLRMYFGLDGECTRVKDIAVRLGITTETVRIHREHGLAMLRARLAPRHAA